MVENKDEIANLFKDKLTDFQAEVRPEIWNAVSSKVGLSQTAVSSGMSVLTKTIISLITLAAVGTIALVVFTDKKEKINQAQKAEKQQNVQIIEEPKNKISETKNESKPVLIEPNVLNTLSESTLEKTENETLPDIKSTHQETKSSDPEIILEQELTTQIMESPSAVLSEKQPVTLTDPEMDEPKNTEVILRDLPNVFTPNNDGSNDFFEIKSEGLIDFNVVILNEENKVVYSSSTPDFKWDGSLMNGDAAPSGTYLYYLTAKDPKQNVISRSSLLKLIR